jgi:uncharacterized protein (TIGR02145 family)
MKITCKVLFTTLAVWILSQLYAGSAISQVKDIDGNEYNTYIVGKYTWTTSNLNAEKYRNGDPIPQVQDMKEWASLKTGAWCWFENNSENGIVYGKLYNWYAVNDPRGLAPQGWHIPSKEEWEALIDNFGGTEEAGAKLKNYEIWESPNLGATYTCKFKALPGGFRQKNGEFFGTGKYGGFWMSNLNDEGLAWAAYMNNYLKDIFLNPYDENVGLSVRVVKD